MLVKWNYDRLFDPNIDLVFKPWFSEFLNCLEDDMFIKYKDGEDLVLMSEVPGLKKDEVEVTIKNKVLTIKGKTKDKRAYKKYSFTKEYVLPDNIDIENVAPEAALKDGILRIEFKGFYKKEESPKTKELKVKIK